MVAYSFKPWFAKPILLGTKRQTIRADRKRHARPGEATQLYTGMRTKHCRLIGTATCVDAIRIAISFQREGKVCFGGTVFRSRENLDEFARADGFDDWNAMRQFWIAEHPGVEISAAWHGVMISWTAFKGAEA